MIRSIDSALTGLARNVQAFDRAADRVSRIGQSSREGGESIDIAAEIVGMMEARFGYRADLAVIRTADEMLGTAIDMLA